MLPSGTASSNRLSVLRAAIAALLALSCVAGIPRPVHADQGGYREHEFREHEFRREEFRDSRYHHDHYYPPRGYVFNVLPPHPRMIVHGGQPFYFSGGIWYCARWISIKRPRHRCSSGGCGTSSLPTVASAICSIGTFGVRSA